MTKQQDPTNHRLINPPPAEPPDPEVVPKAERRQFSAAYKRQIVEAADACTEPGQIGALLRREGLYSSHLSTWRRQRDAGKLDGTKRGRQADATAVQIRELKAENARLRRELEKVNLIVEAQKKLADVVGLTIQENEAK
jgi:transposase-like protein